MKITNNFGLPDPIVRAIENDPYDSGDCDISTTRLINPPQLEALKIRHHEEIVEDASERIWSLVGQTMHVILERAAKTKRKKSQVSEKRYFAEMEGWRVSGAVDLLDATTLVDYKMTSVWTYIFGSRMEEWTAQNNVNRWLYHMNGGHITHLKNILIFRDWARRDSLKRSDYPPIQVATVDLPLWSLEEAENYVRERVILHQYARKLSNQDLPKCTDEERWYSQKTNKYNRCEDYCSVKSFCAQYAHMKAHVQAA